MLLRSEERRSAPQAQRKRISVFRFRFPGARRLPARKHWFLLGSLLIVGFILRLNRIDSMPLWVDEAESCLNALSILQSGLPTNEYLGLPLYENTLTIPSPQDPEYEFRDSSYGRPIYKGHGLALYHGWLPLYAIAGSFRLFGIKPDPPGARSPRYTASEREFRTVAARLPGVLFGVLSILGLYLAGSRLHSRSAGLVAAFIATFLSVHVSFSEQARYYGATLATVSFCAWSMACIMQSQRWRDFVTGAFLFVLLFHTHLLCFAIAVLVLAASQIFTRNRSAIPKWAAFAAIVGVFTIPWILITGLPQQMSGIPPAWTLLSFPRDFVITRFFASEFGVVAMAGVALLALCAIARRWGLAASIADVFRPYFGSFVFLYGWLVLGYFGFLFLTPAASFWMTRFALTLLVQLILLISMFLCSAARLIPTRRHLVIAMAGASAFVGISNLRHHPQPTASQIAQSQRDIDAVIAYLTNAHLKPDTLLFATPNEHFVIEFYTGLPVQSIAPVRKSFLDSYPGDIILFSKENLVPNDAIEPDILRAAAPSSLSQTQAQNMSCEIASYPFRKQLAAQVATVFPAIVPIPAFAATAAQDYLRQKQEQTKILDLTLRWNTPMFKHVDIETGFDWWNQFFYAFVDPEKRKHNPNYRGRFRNATATVLTCTDWVAQYSTGRGEHGISR